MDIEREWNEIDNSVYGWEWEPATIQSAAQVLENQSRLYTMLQDIYKETKAHFYLM